MIRTLRLAVAFGLLAALVAGTGTVVAGHGGPHKIVDTRLVGVPSPPVIDRRRERRRPCLDRQEGQGKAVQPTAGVNLHVHGLVLFPGGHPARGQRARGGLVQRRCARPATSSGPTRSALATQTATCPLQRQADPAEPVLRAGDLRHQPGRATGSPSAARPSQLSGGAGPWATVRSDSRTAAGLLSARRRSTSSAAPRC